MAVTEKVTTHSSLKEGAHHIRQGHMGSTRVSRRHQVRGKKVWACLFAVSSRGCRSGRVSSLRMGRCEEFQQALWDRASRCLVLAVG